MSDQNTAAPAVKKAPKAPKAAKKTKAPKIVAQAVGTNGAPTAPRKGSLPDGITRPQARILAELCRAKHQLTRKQIAEAAGVALSWITGYTSKACGANVGPSLVERGLAKAVKVEVEEGIKETGFAPTAAGRKMNERIAKLLATSAV